MYLPVIMCSTVNTVPVGYKYLLAAELYQVLGTRHEARDDMTGLANHSKNKQYNNPTACISSLQRQLCFTQLLRLLGNLTRQG